ncbi:heme-binding protein [Gluconacetobacter asukensis]|uniref:Heme-binding protein n=2 Tax=Gluconacetobacter asukensis TaxID=1017181 RepID=A0A7W4J2N7_9PROT|nr:heme-binding protein [Gluconacetobacter asukensis]
MKWMFTVLAALASFSAPALAQSSSTAPQLNITTEAALNMAHYAVGLAESRHLKLCIAIEDTDGNLVAFTRMQGAYAGCVEASIAKAKSAARFARNTIEFFDAARAQNLPIGFVPGILPSAGGAVFKQGDVVVGSIGTSGDTNENEQALVIDAAKHFH